MTGATTAYTPSTYQSQLLDGAAQIVGAAGLAVYRGPDGLYQDGERGIYFVTRPDDSVESLTLSPYMEQSNMNAVEHTRIQFLSRHRPGNTLAALDWCQELRFLFHQKTHLTVGGHRFDLVRQFSATARGYMADGMLEHSQNFIFRGNRYGL